MKITEKYLETVINITKLHHEENELRRIPMETEKGLMDKIRLGKYKELQLSNLSQIDDRLIPMIESPRTRSTYLVVSAIALFSRTAIEAGVKPDDAFDLSDGLLWLLSQSKTSHEIYHLYQIAAVSFAKKVHQLTDQKNSYQLRRALNYISNRIYQKITLEEVASHLNLSSNYLCTLFSREMGISIHNYIQREKTAIACNLLMHTDRPLSDIATYLGFQTQSNFSKVFRKWQGMTPTEYRCKEYREVY